MSQARWHRIDALSRAIEGYAGDDSRLREQLSLFLDLDAEEVSLAVDLARWKRTPEGRTAEAEPEDLPWKGRQ